MMNTIHMSSRDRFIKALLDDNVIEYDDRSTVSEHVRWGVDLGYFNIREIEQDGIKIYNHTAVVELTEVGILYAEFLTL